MRSVTLVMLMLLPVLFMPVITAAETHHWYVDASAEGPGDGSADDPFPTLWDALRPGFTYPPGDEVHVHIAPGVYRELASKAGWKLADIDLILEGDPVNRPVISGADTLTQWTQESGVIWHTPWEYNFYQGHMEYDEDNLYAHAWLYGGNPNDEYRAEYLTRWESVWVDGERMQQVLSLNEAGPGTFYIDQEQDRLYLWTPNGSSPNNYTVAATTRINCVNFLNMSDVTLRNLEFRQAQMNVRAIETESITLDNCVVRESVQDAIVVNRGAAMIIRDTMIRDNGFNGIHPSFQFGIELENVVIRDNNWRGAHVNAGNWRVAGAKFYAVSGVTMRNVTVSGNVCTGLWFDRYCDNVRLDDCRLIDNYGSGFFWEISPGPLTLNNTEFSNNGRGMNEMPDLQTTYVGLWINSGANIHANRCTFSYNTPFNVQIQNSGRTAELWKPGQSGESDPIHVDHLDFGYCVFEHDGQQDRNIYVPSYLHPEQYWGDGRIIVSPEATADEIVPAEYQLDGVENPRLVVHPNPTNAATTLSYSLPEASNVSIRVFDLLGRTVQSIDRRHVPGGDHRMVIDGTHLASGTYFIALHAGGKQLGLQKVVFVK